MSGHCCITPWPTYYQLPSNHGNQTWHKAQTLHLPRSSQAPVRCSKTLQEQHKLAEAVLLFLVSSALEKGRALLCEKDSGIATDHILTRDLSAHKTFGLRHTCRGEFALAKMLPHGYMYSHYCCCLAWVLCKEAIWGPGHQIFSGKLMQSTPNPTLRYNGLWKAVLEELQSSHWGQGPAHTWGMDVVHLGQHTAFAAGLCCLLPALPASVLHTPAKQH